MRQDGVSVWFVVGLYLVVVVVVVLLATRKSESLLVEACCVAGCVVDRIMSPAMTNATTSPKTSVVEERANG